MAIYSQEESHEFDRALLAVVTTQPEVYSKGKLAADYRGHKIYPAIEGHTRDPLIHLPEATICDEERLLVSVPTNHPLMEARHKDKLHPKTLTIARFNTALRNKYGLGSNAVSVLSANGVADKNSEASEYKKPPMMLLLIKQDDLQRLAVQALEKLADPAKATSILELEYGYQTLPYAEQITDPDSNLVAMIKAIYHNGEFAKGDRDIARIMQDASKKGIGNFDFAILLRDLDDPSKAKKTPLQHAERDDTPPYLG